jgi:hypothetical protein
VIRKSLGAGCLLLAASAIPIAQIAPSGSPRTASRGRPQAEVLILASYHMNNPGHDIFNLKADDVLAPGRLAEMPELLDPALVAAMGFMAEFFNGSFCYRPHILN